VGVYFEVLFHILFSWLGLPVLGLIVAVALVSRSVWGKRIGLPRLCIAGYLFFLVLLYWLGAAQGEDSLGYGWLPLLAATLPWSFLFDPFAGQGLSFLFHWIEGSRLQEIVGMALNFIVLVGVYGGLNSLFALSVSWIAGRMTRRLPDAA